MSNRIEKVIVVGRDADAWLTALMLQLSFAKSEKPLDVQLIELPSKLHPQDYYSVLPSHKAMHKMLGIEEHSLLRASSGLYALAQRFSNWSPSHTFMHAYDTHGIGFSNIDFFQYWLKASAKGLNVPLEDFSLGAVAAKQGRFVVLDDAAESFSKATHGYHLSALPYLKVIAGAAINAGVTHHVSDIKSIDVTSEAVRSIRLQDDTLVEGDLYIDATGSDAALISLFDQGESENWQAWFPCDRVITASSPLLNPSPAFSQIAAFAKGWIGFFPLLNRTAVAAVYSSKHTEHSEIIRNLQPIPGIKLDGAIDKPISVSARKKQWICNCIALGSAAVNLDPLDATHMHMLDVGLSLLRTLFPVDKAAMKEAAIFNEKMYWHATNARDFQITHYKLNKRFGEPLWDEVRDMEIPATLNEKFALFKARGRVAMQENETFQEESWTSIFVGHGLQPITYDPLVDNMPEQEQIEHFQKILKYIAGEIQSMPSLQAYVEMNA